MAYLPAMLFAQDGVADAVHLRQDEQHEAEQDAARCGAQPLGSAGLEPGPVTSVLNPVQDAGEHDADCAGDEAEQREEQVLDEVVDLERRQFQERFVAQGGPTDDAGGDRGQHDHPEGLGGEVGEDQFHREEHPGQGCVERCRDTAGRATGHQHAHSGFSNFDDPPEGGAQSGADLHDRAFPSHRSAAADAQRRGQRLDPGDLWGDASAATMNGEHHLGHSVSARLAGKYLHQRPVQQAGDHRRQNYEPPTQARDVRVGDVTEAGIIAVPGQRLGEDLDQPAEHDRAAAGAGPDDQGQHQQAAVG